MQDKIKTLNDKIAEAHLGGGVKRIAKQHSNKKLTARERIDYLMDEGSFEEIGMLVTHRSTDFGLEKEMYYGDGVITGYGTIETAVNAIKRGAYNYLAKPFKVVELPIMVRRGLHERQLRFENLVFTGLNAQDFNVRSELF